ncbi:MAG TPA: substrate-binding domain-containing protein [Anaeromyxobacteraceae bacterium]|nr:substrate-binding domain-containing protein [Anaeromyxobacteraceae bacterium]
MTRAALPLLVSCLALAATGPARGEEAAPAAGKALRVCADPNNLPFSNSRGEGFENRIAALLARDLGWPLEYTWFPQRMGFVRNTLKRKDPVSGAFACDVVMGVPAEFDLTDTTTPYYRSTYAMVFARGHGLDGVRAPDDVLTLDPPVLRSLRFGLFGRTPPTEWLLRHGLMGQAVPYPIQTGDPDQFPGDVIERDLAAGRIDVALVWGPIAGYLATRRAAAPLAVVAFPAQAGIRFDFSVSMGVRKGDDAWRAVLEQFLARNRGAIQAILSEYGVPQLEPAATAAPLRPGYSSR